MRAAKAMTLTDEGRVTLTRVVAGLQRSVEAGAAAEDHFWLWLRDTREQGHCGGTRLHPRAAGIWRNRFVVDRLKGIERDVPPGDRRSSLRTRFEAEILCKTTQQTLPNATQ